MRKLFDESEFGAVRPSCRPSRRPALAVPSKLYAETNISGTLNLLELARDFDIKQFVFGSSSSVYGINSKVPFSEDDRIQQPISPYAATKAAGELLCHTYSHLFGIRTVCLRFFTVYGETAARSSDPQILPPYRRGQTDSGFRRWQTRRDYTYIDDIIQGVRASIDYDGSIHEVFNLGESETTELSRLIDLLEENLDIKAVIDRQPMQPGDVPTTYADVSKARKLLGYDPKTKIEVGIPKFVEWFRESRVSVAA